MAVAAVLPVSPEAGTLCDCRDGGADGGVVRAPLTGIVLVLEMTDNQFQLHFCQ